MKGSASRKNMFEEIILMNGNAKRDTSSLAISII
jgi:hypothetical protein